MLVSNYLHGTARMYVLCTARRPLPFLLYSFTLHAASEALLIATVLAAVALPLVDDAVALLAASVRQVFADRALEEAFAAFAAERGTMIPFKNISKIKLRKKIIVKAKQNLFWCSAEKNLHLSK